MKFAFRTLIFVGLFYAIAPLAYAETSLDELQQQADRGDMNAQFQLGRKYHIGDGVERDVEKAVFWYQKLQLKGAQKRQIIWACYMSMDMLPPRMSTVQ